MKLNPGLMNDTSSQSSGAQAMERRITGLVSKPSNRKVRTAGERTPGA